MLKKLTKNTAIILLGVFAAFHGVGLYASFHGHDSDEHACVCTNCHHDAELDDVNISPSVPEASDEMACQICSMMDGLPKPKDVETSLDDHPSIKGVIPAPPNPWLRQSPRQRFSITVIPDLRILSPHLLHLASVIIRC